MSVQSFVAWPSKAGREGRWEETFPALSPRKMESVMFRSWNPPAIQDCNHSRPFSEKSRRKSSQSYKRVRPHRSNIRRVSRSLYAEASGVVGEDDKNMAKVF